MCPPLNTHSEIYSYESSRLAVDKEYYYMQGVDVDDSVAGIRGRSPFMKCVQHLSNKEARLLAGNGIHLATWGAFWLWAMSHCKRREIPSASASRPLGSGSSQAQETEQAEDQDTEIIE